MPFLSFLPIVHGRSLAPDWRLRIEEIGKLDLGTLVTVQPWASLDALAFFVCGWLFLAVRLAEQPEEEDRQDLVAAFAAAAAGVALLGLVQYFWRPFLPWWNQAIHTSFGPFPNRNEFGDLLALGGICSLVGALQRIHQSNARMAFHYAALVVCFAALVCNGSRGGLILFFGGGLTWLVWVSLQSRSLKFGGRVTAIIMVFLALFLVFGGSLVGRVLSMHLSGSSMEADFRLLLARDVFWMVRHVPLFGIGIGNFEQVFALFRRFSENGMLALHPDSDLMWALGETGFVGVLLVVGGIVVGMGAWFPIRRGTTRSLHIGMVIAALAFLIHGIFEVPLHRLGSLLPGLFLIGSALASPTKPSLVPKGPKVIPPFVFWTGGRFAIRLLGGALCLVGLLWVLPGGASLWPPRASAEAREAAVAANAKRDYALGEDRATAALRARPLDWFPYYLRAEDRYAGRKDYDGAALDFRIASALQPTRADIRLAEASLWYPIRPAYGLDIISEAMLVSKGAEKARIYSEVLDSLYDANPALHPALLDLAGDNFSLQLIYFAHADRDDAAVVLKRLLKIDAQLRFVAPVQLSQILQRWALIGNLPDLVARIEENPTWDAAGWPIVAKYYAGRGDTRRAMTIVHRFDPLPPFPKLEPTDSKDKLLLDARLRPNAVQPR
ncbi:MAG TPA: O-antigen ligase family protein, partial [Candidatus Methylacidiphilales bacterium]